MNTTTNSTTELSILVDTRAAMLAQVETMLTAGWAFDMHGSTSWAMRVTKNRTAYTVTMDAGLAL